MFFFFHQYHIIGASFLVRCKIKLPGQDVFVSEEYDYYEAQHLYVGATLDINGFIFILIDADEYALRYMEIHCEKVKIFIYNKLKCF